MTLRDELGILALALVDERRPAYTLRNEVLAMKAIFEKAGGQSFAASDSDLAAGETGTPYGVAISPRMAAMCVDDFARTVQFIRGIHAAITDAGSMTGRARAVRVLYAGCGPWATLATPLMALFSANQVTFTLLDLHSESLKSVRGLLNTLELSDRVDSMATADASSERIDKSSPPDILVIEMLRAAVESEPQVAVARNLFEQAPAAMMVPQEIRIDLALVNASREFNIDEEPAVSRDRIMIAPVFVVNGSTLSSSSMLSPVTVEIPPFDEKRYNLMLLTTIQVYGRHYLRDYDSGITLPKALPHDLEARPGVRLTFDYEVGIHPRLIARVLQK